MTLAFCRTRGRRQSGKAADVDGGDAMACSALHWRSTLGEDTGDGLRRRVAQLVGTHRGLHDFVLPYPSKAGCAGDAGRRSRMHNYLNIMAQALDILVDEALDVELRIEIQHMVKTLPERRRVLDHRPCLLQLSQRAHV